MRNGLFLIGPKNPATNKNEFKNDTYILLARHLIAEGALDRVFFCYNCNKNISTKNIKTYSNISINFLNSEKDYNSIYKNEYSMTFVRGNWLEHQKIMKKVNSKLNYFYAADPKYSPVKKMLPFIDIVFVDEKNQAVKNKKNIVFDKIINTDIFKPKKSKKKYDLSYVANFRQWKNHNLLFSAIYKYQIKSNKQLKIALMGKFEPNTNELKTMLWKFNINADLFEKISPFKVADLINKSKFTVQMAEIDANPRAITESLACNVPVLVNNQLSGGIRLANKTANPWKFDLAIKQMLTEYKNYQPYKYFKNSLTADKIINSCFKDLKNIK